MREVLLLDDEFKELELSPRISADDPNIVEVVWVVHLPGAGCIRYSACYVRKFLYLKPKLRLMTFEENGYPIVAVKK